MANGFRILPSSGITAVPPALPFNVTSSTDTFAGTSRNVNRSSIRNIYDFASASSGRLLTDPVYSDMYNREVPSSERQVSSRVLTQSSPSLEIDNLPDPQLSFHWSVILPWGFPPMYVERVQLPHATIEAIPYHRANSKLNMPGFETVDTVNITFYEDRLGTVADYLQKWFDLVVKDSLYGRPADYKRQIILTLHDSQGKPSTIVRSYGTWPTHFAHSEYSSENGRITIEADFSCDSTGFGRI